MNEQELINEPVELQLDGKLFKFRSISHIRQRAIAQAWYLGQVISEFKDKAEALFDNETEKSTFVRDEMAKLPSGVQLQEKLDEVKMIYPVIIKYLQASLVDPVDQVTIERLAIDSTVAEMRSVLAFIFRSKKNYTSPVTTGISSSDNLANTTPQVKSES